VFPNNLWWIEAPTESNFLQQIKQLMGNNRHTPFNEELQTIFETDNLEMLDAPHLTPVVQETKTEEDVEREH